MTYYFYVPGRPVPAGSKRAFWNKKTGKPIVTDVTGQRGKDWRGDIRAIALEHREGKLLEGALELRVDFYLQRPKSHFRKDGSLKKSAPWHHVISPDTTKLVRAIEDALNGVLWVDDCQIVKQRASKSYAFPEDGPGACIDIREV